MRFITIIFGLLTLLQVGSLKAQELNGERSEIENQIRTQLKKYEKYGDLTEDAVTISQEYISSFQSLFAQTRQAQVYDFLNSKGGSISINEYIEKISTYFPNGIELIIEPESIVLGEEKIIDGNTQRPVQCQLSVIGLSKDNTLKKVSEKVLFQFVYSSASDVKIQSVHLYKAFHQTKINRAIKGLYVGVGASYLSTEIQNDAIDSDNDWTIQGQKKISASIEAKYMFHRNFGVASGISYTNYEAQLAGNYSTKSKDSPLIDKDGDTYHLHVNSNLAETNNIHYLEVPLYFVLSIGPSERVRFNVQPGVKLGYNILSEYDVKGSTDRKAYYPKYNILLEDVKSYDYTTQTYDETGEWEISQFNLSVSLKTEFGVQLTNNIFANLGYEFSKGLTDLNYSKPKYRDDFIGVKSKKTDMTTLSHGVYFSIHYKL